MSRTSQRASLLRCCLLWLSVTAGSVGVLALVRGELPARLTWAPRHLDGVPFDALLVTGCAVALAACAAWLWLLTTLVLLEAMTGLPVWRAGCPDGLRRLILTACGVALVAGATPLAPSSADTSAGLPPAPPETGHSRLAGLQLPDRATAGRAPTMEPGGRDTVRVRPGDTLWDLAAERLPDRAGDADIAVAWHRIWEANRSRIGNDPDLIHPGNVLRLPEPKELR